MEALYPFLELAAVTTAGARLENVCREGEISCGLECNQFRHCLRECERGEVKAAQWETFDKPWLRVHWVNNTAIILKI